MVTLVLFWVSIRASLKSRLPWHEVWQQAHLRRPCAWYCFQCLSENWYFEGGEIYICGHLCATSLLFCICSPNPWVLFPGVGVCCWMSPSACLAPGVFVPIRVSCRSVIDVVWVGLVCCTRLIRTLNHCLFSELLSASTRVRYMRAVVAAHPLEFEVSRCRTSQFARSLTVSVYYEFKRDHSWGCVFHTLEDGEAVEEWKCCLCRS